MYESFFGLTAKPFRITTDPALLFRSTEHRRAMSFVKYGLRQGEGFIVVTGEPGAGKTTLAHEMARRLDPTRITTARIDASEFASGDTMASVAAAFGVPTEGARASILLTRIETLLKVLHASGKRAVLIIDEAQNLTPAAFESLRLLSNLQADGKSVPIFLVGQASLRVTLRQPALAALQQRVTAACHLGPMSPEDTRAYIEYRLQRAGWQGDPSFGETTHQRIFDASQGIARRINVICDRLLLAAYLGEHHHVTADDVGAVLADMADEFAVDTSAAATSAPHAPADDSGQDRLLRLEQRVDVLDNSQQSLSATIADLLSRHGGSDRPGAHL